MQIARQIYGITTAENALVFFNDGEPAYITKRFDILTDSRRLLQEDFAQIAGRTEETHGKNYKYDFSHEEIAILMKQHVKAYLPEIEKYFQIILFNYLFSSGDSHLKNFSLTRNEEFGDYLLAPFYDLMDTLIHVPEESYLALDLFKDNYISEAYKAGIKYTGSDFIEFGKKTGISETRIKKLYAPFVSPTVSLFDLIEMSFLSDKVKEIYKDHFTKKAERLMK
jgi:serine/threonine-protein kinase HipA